MRTLVLGLRVIILTVLIGLPVAWQALALRPAATEDSGATLRSVETRFAIRYCTSQYRSQVDLDRCLAKLLPPNARSA
jgi:hypothetical protein